MNTRRSKSLKFVSSKSEPIEVEIEGTSQMNTVYCCISKGHQILYTYNANPNSDQNQNLNTNSKSKLSSLDSLAQICLENAPPHQKFYFHTVGTRTFGFLFSEGLTYFAIVDPSVGNLGILHFLENIRDGHKNSVRNGYNESLVPIIKKLINSLENMPKSTFFYQENGECSNGDGAPLLGKNGSRKKMKERERGRERERERERERDNEEVRDRGFRVDIMQEEGGSSSTSTGNSMSVERNPNSNRTRRQMSGRNLWWRHVKIVILVNVALCLVLFVIWLVVCKGFECVK